MSKKLSRNDRCPQCGKKMKNCPGHESALAKKGPAIAIAIVILVVVIVVTALIVDELGSNKISGKQAVEAYFAKHASEDWWFPSASMPIDEQLRQTEQATFRIEKLLVRYNDLNDLTRRIWQHFNNFQIMVFRQGLTMGVGEGSFDLASMELCFVPKDQRQHKRVRSQLCWYDSEWKALMMKAVKVPDSWLAALLYHELGHALRHRVDHAPSATARAGSDSWISEEVEMHEVETAVLDAYCEGALTERLDQIIRHCGGAGGAVLVDAISTDDLEEFDRLLLDDGELPSGVVGTALAQYQMALLFRHADKTARDPAAEKIKAYRWLTARR